ncbi:hypothetical protein D3C87_1416760 [compost metagenome]
MMTSLTVKLVKPTKLTLILYVPGFKASNLKSPFSSVDVVLKGCSIPVSYMATTADGIGRAPTCSITLPVMMPFSAIAYTFVTLISKNRLIIKDKYFFNIG